MPDQHRVRYPGRLRVFLCHSSGDKAAVRELHRKLKGSGFSPWLDEEELLPGQDWRAEISAAIRACHAVIVCLSKQSVSKEGYLHKEILEAISSAEEKPDGAIFIIPARLEKEVHAPPKLERWQWVDLFEERGYARLTTALEARARALGIDPSKYPQMTLDRSRMRHETLNELERSYDIMLEKLGDAIDLRDLETSGHSKRVTAYTIALARHVGLSLDESRIIARGAFLHDIGKIAIPDTILRKPGPLSEKEQQIVRDHCKRGFEMVKNIPFLADAADIVYAHQEHYDGSGYPRGLRGEEIPIGARIFAVADALDAITSDRPYRRGSGFDVAREEIQRCSGTQFDPTVVQVYSELPVELWIDLRTEMNRH